MTALAVIIVHAQEEIPTENLRHDTIPSYLRPIPLTAPDSASTLTPLQMQQLERLKETLSMPSLFEVNEGYARSSASRIVTSPGFAGFRLWKGATAYASGSRSSLPGLIGIEQGNLGFSQSLGRFTLDAYASAAHYGYFRGLQTAYGFGGSLNYRLSNRISLTIFGSYYTDVHPLTPAMAAYMNSSNFGGYASFDINEHWGISVGAQAVHSNITNRWEPQPILAPYYKINGKAAFGLDVGGILYNLIKSKHGGYRRGNPTIGPPVGGPPPVAPRR